GKRRAEVAVEVRADLVSLAVPRRDRAQRPARVELAARKAEADVGAPDGVPRRVVEVAVRPVDQVDAADEEREARVGPARDRAPVAPEPRPARAVEGDDDEPRRAARPRRRREGAGPRGGRAPAPPG